MSLTADQLRNEAAANKIPMATVAYCAGIDASRLSAFLNGRKELNGDLPVVERVLGQLKALKQSVDVPVDFSNSAAVKVAIERREERQSRALFLVRKQLKDLKLWSRENGYCVDVISALQFKNPLSTFAIERILDGTCSDENELQSLSDLVAAIKHLSDMWAAAGGLDFEHEDLKEIRWHLAEEYKRGQLKRFEANLNV